MIQRLFYPGDRWVYYKLYCNPSVGNDILLDKIYPLLCNWELDNLISRWFFIRYADPLPHIRVRFELTSLDNLGETILLFKQAIEPYIKNGFIHKYQIDTYVREIERYGIDTIDQCETFFYKDSLHVAQFIKDNSFSEITYILDSINWMYSLFSKIGLSDSDIKSLATNMSSAYSKEMNITTRQKVYIDSLFRIHKNNILKIVKTNNSAINDWGNLKWINQMNTANPIITSLIHMHVNRLFSNNQRMYEYIIYYLFMKAFNSFIHMNKFNTHS